MYDFFFVRSIVITRFSTIIAAIVEILNDVLTSEEDTFFEYVYLVYFVELYFRQMK